MKDECLKISDIQLQRLLELTREATPEPDENYNCDGTICAPCGSMVDVLGDDSDFYDDPICDTCLCEFARKARETIPALLSDLDAKDILIEALVEALKKQTGTFSDPFEDRERAMAARDELQHPLLKEFAESKK